MAEDSAPSVEQMALASLNDGVSTPFAKSEFSNRVLIRTILSRADGGAGLAGQTVKVGGWVKTGGEQGKGSFSFLDLNDGSCPANLQVVVDVVVAPLGQIVPTGACVHVEGLLKLPPKGTKQRVEIRVKKVFQFLRRNESDLMLWSLGMFKILRKMGEIWDLNWT